MEFRKERANTLNSHFPRIISQSFFGVNLQGQCTHYRRPTDTQNTQQTTPQSEGERGEPLELPCGPPCTRWALCCRRL